MRKVGYNKYSQENERIDYDGLSMLKEETMPIQSRRQVESSQRKIGKEVDWRRYKDM